MEEWRDIEGYEGLYQISDFGNVKALAKSWISGKGLVKSIPDTILKLSIRKNGYLRITLNNPIKTFQVHRLVAEAFIPNPENKPEVNHKDGNKLNNHKDNLEWNTSSENLKHAIDNGLKRVFSKLSNEDIKSIFELKDKIKVVDIAKQFNVKPITIYKILQGNNLKRITNE